MWEGVVPAKRHPQTEPAPAGSLIDLRDVARRDRMGEVTVTALEGVDLRIGKGEFTVVLGPSDSGKTTLVNIIGALDVTSEGRVVIAGRDITRASSPPRASVARTSRRRRG